MAQLLNKLKIIMLNEQFKKGRPIPKSDLERYQEEKKISSSITKPKPDKKTSTDKSTSDKPKEDVKVTPSDINIKIFLPGREQLHIDNWEFVRAVQKSIENKDKDNKVY